MIRLPRTQSKRLILAIIVLLLVGGAGFAWYVGRQKPPAQQSTQQSDAESSPAKSTANSQVIRLIATGDVIAHDSVNDNAKRADGSYDYLNMMKNMQPFFAEADIRFCNQATPAGGTSFGISGYPVFNAPLELTRDMTRLGCNVVNLGTNHTNDKGQLLINAMVNAWDDQKVLAHAGANRTPAERDTVKYFETKGVKFAFLSYSTYTNSPIANGYGVTMYSASLAERQMTEARQKADIILVSMRWGTEYSDTINARQTLVAQELANLGADIVMGHGPHVLQPVKTLQGREGKKTIVWYSLGNFLNTQLQVEALTGVIGVLDIDVSTKKITKVSALPIYNHYEWTAADKRAENLRARKNVTMYALDKAREPVERSQLNTTVDAQTARIKDVLNRFMPVQIITSAEY